MAGSCLTQVVCNEIGVTLIWVFAQLCAPGKALPVLMVLLHLPKSENLELSAHEEYFISFVDILNICRFSEISLTSKAFVFWWLGFLLYILQLTHRKALQVKLYHLQM